VWPSLIRWGAERWTGAHEFSVGKATSAGTIFLQSCLEPTETSLKGRRRDVIFSRVHTFEYPPTYTSPRYIACVAIFFIAPVVAVYSYEASGSIAPLAVYLPMMILPLTSILMVGYLYKSFRPVAVDSTCIHALGPKLFERRIAWIDVASIRLEQWMDSSKKRRLRVRITSCLSKTNIVFDDTITGFRALCELIDANLPSKEVPISMISASPSGLQQEKIATLVDRIG
jgi:hypothetical protein